MIKSIKKLFEFLTKDFYFISSMKNFKMKILDIISLSK